LRKTTVLINLTLLINLIVENKYMEILHIWKMTRDTPNIVLFFKDKLKGNCKNRKPKRVKVLCSFFFFPNYHYETHSHFLIYHHACLKYNGAWFLFVVTSRIFVKSSR